VVVLLLLYVGVYVLFTVLYWGRVTVSLLTVDGLTVEVVGTELLVAVVVFALLTSVATLSVLVDPVLLTVEVAVRLVEDVLPAIVEDPAVDVGATLLLAVVNDVLDDVTDLLAARLLLRKEDIAPVPAVLLLDRLLIRSLLPY
jgi:hypothetical protein